jgi:long-chain acyl-CoA synthetase
MIHVPVYPTIGHEEYSYILDHSGVKAVITGNKQIYKQNFTGYIKNPAIRAVYTFDDVNGLVTVSDIIEEGRNNRENPSVS